MPELIPNTFSSYSLTDEEAREGSTFNTYQTCVIQNLISDIAEEKAAIITNPDDITKSMVHEANLVGQMKILQHLLAISEVSKNLISINVSSDEPVVPESNTEF